MVKRHDLKPLELFIINVGLYCLHFEFGASKKKTEGLILLQPLLQMNHGVI